MIKRTVCAIMVLLIVLASLTACSSGKSSSQAEGKTEFGQSGGNRQGTSRVKDSGAQDTPASKSQTQIIGKVNSIIGNEVELDVGTMSSDTNSSSNEFVSSGDTKTLLIPVGLSLTGTGTTAGAGTAGAEAGAAAAGGAAPGGGTAAGGTTIGRSETGTSTRKSASAKSASATKTTAGTATAGSTIKRATGFSSITQGMILRITQKEINGTLTVVKVAVVSK